jgi:hypothetical protein
MNEINEIIAFACLKFHDSGETSVNREARLIVEALENNGYTIIKENAVHDNIE